MRLFYQLVILIFLYTITIAVVIYLNTVKTSIDYVQHQLYTDAENTSHWLAMSITHMSDHEDVTLMKLMIDAAYDAGFYDEITLVDTKGNIIHTRKNNAKIQDVPEWFIRLIALDKESLSSSSDIVLNWQRFGELKVYGHTGEAYQKMYESARRLAMTFITSIGLGLLILYFILSYTLLALKRIRKQATSVLNNEFVIEEKLPFTLELRSVVDAMNQMIIKVKDVFDRENQILRENHELMYIDNETSLSNRRYLLVQFPHFLDKENCTAGSYVMFSFVGLEHYEKEYGYRAYMNCLQLFSNKLKSFSDSNEDVLISRLNKTDFFLMIPNSFPSDLKRSLEELMQTCEAEVKATVRQPGNGLILNGGIGTYSCEDTPHQLLSRGDQAIMVAQTQGNFTIYIDELNKDDISMGREEWRNTIMDALREGRGIFAVQPVFHMVDGQKNILHQEIWLRLTDKNGELMKAANFIPIATALGLMDILDRYQIEHLFHCMRDHLSAHPVAINLNKHFINNASNRIWLKDKLKIFKERCKTNLYFEVNNRDVMNYPASVQVLFEIMKSFDFEVGIDNFLLTDKGADYLKSVRPNYIKVNVQYLKDVLLDETTGKIKNNFTNLLESLGIKIIATHIENESDIVQLKNMNINRLQGFGLAKIEYKKEFN